MKESQEKREESEERAPCNKAITVNASFNYFNAHFCEPGGLLLHAAVDGALMKEAGSEKLITLERPASAFVITFSLVAHHQRWRVASRTNQQQQKMQFN